MEMFDAATAKLIMELGAFGVLLLLYAIDRLLGQPRRDKAHQVTIDKLLGEAKKERDEMFSRFERITDKLSGAIDRLSQKIEDIEKHAANK